MFNGPIPNGLIVDHEDGDELNNKKGNLRVIRQVFNTRNADKRMDNNSGITGVSKYGNGRGTYYWAARWTDNAGKNCTARFNIGVLGDTLAFEMACQHRTKMIDELNSQGAGYTDRHGT